MKGPSLSTEDVGSGPPVYSPISRHSKHYLSILFCLTDMASAYIITSPLCGSCLLIPQNIKLALANQKESKTRVTLRSSAAGL